MARLARHGLGTIRQRLIVGFGLLVALLIVAGAVGRVSMSAMSGVIRSTLASVQDESQLSARLSSSVTEELSMAAQYLESRDSIAQNGFRRLGWEAHRVQREMNNRPGQTTQEVALVAAIDAKLSSLEIEYALAHRLADLGRLGEARARADSARVVARELLSDVRALGELKSRKVSSASEKLRLETDRRGSLLLVVITVAVAVGVFGGIGLDRLLRG